jgi:hypothetical protein
MKKFTERLLPQTMTNHYSGSPIAFYGLILITGITLIRSLIHIIAPDGGAQSIATIPLDQYSPEAAQAVIGMFALWGLSQLIVGLIMSVVLIAYRSLIPAMYVVVLFEYGLRATLLPLLKPIQTIDTAPGALANWPMVVLSVILLLMSLKDYESKSSSMEKL